MDNLSNIKVQSEILDKDTEAKRIQAQLKVSFSSRNMKLQKAWIDCYSLLIGMFLETVQLKGTHPPAQPIKCHCKLFYSFKNCNVSFCNIE